MFSYAGVQQGTPQADALNAAFDRVNAVRVLVFTDNPRTLLLDVVIAAEADDEGIEVEVEVPGVEPGQQLIVVILGLEIVDGVTTELFTTGELSVTAQAADDENPAQEIEAPLTYTGPGAAAASVEITGGDLVLSPEASRALGSVVLDPEGGEIANVPVAWTSGNASVASVDDAGVVTGVSDGRTEVTVTTPNGQAASTTVYVIDGLLAFVQGGQVMTASAGTEAAARGGSGARGPAWSPDGARLFYGAGGQVREAGGGALTGGSWPSVSPDGTKLAVQAGGRVGFANIDGSQPTEGPEGTTPSWLGSSTLVVDGGSVHQVRANGADRTTLVGNLRARMPAVGGGQILYVGSDDKVHVVGGGVVLDVVVNSRPALSPSGRWVVGSTAAGLQVGPADGSGPILRMGFPGARDPVFQTLGALEAPPVLTLSGFLPAEPIPGQPVEILGSGFDWIIPANTSVEFPTAEGPVLGEITEVHSDRIVTTTPRDLVAGQVTVRTLTGEASLTVEPPRFGSVEFWAMTPWDAPVGGVEIALLQDGVVAGSATTESDGMATIDGLLFGDYTLGVTPPEGFTQTGGDAAVTVAPTVAHADIELTPLVDGIETIPANLTISVGEVIDVEIIPLDLNGNVIPVVAVKRWAGTSAFISWAGRDLNGIIRGLAPTSTPGQARVPILINGQDFELPVTVIGGPVGLTIAPATAEKLLGGTQQFSVTDEVSGPFTWSVNGVDGGNTTFGTIDSNGFYTAPSALPTPATFPVCARITAQPGISGCATVTIAPIPTAGEDVVVFNDVNSFDNTGMSFADNVLMVQNLVNFTSSGPRSSGTRVWLDHGRTSACALLSCATFTTFQSTIEGQGMTFELIVSSSGTLTSFPADLKVIFLWLSRQTYTVAEINALKLFAAEGGRIVYVGEWDGFLGATGIAVENQFLSDMGAQMQNIGDAVDCGSVDLPGTSLRAHQITTGMTAVRVGCASVIVLGPNDFALFFDSTNTKVLAGVAKIDVTPLPSAAAAAALRAPNVVVGPSSDDPTGRHLSGSVPLRNR
ncbi:MAG: Ig-like domain-containing protein [Gemmatimonadetes bacterium]|nr:Ig-like domain-containing protein [Gemmatimonadota bacterium]